MKYKFNFLNYFSFFLMFPHFFSILRSLLFAHKKTDPKVCDLLTGAFDQIRTGDPHLTTVVLYQLSYKGTHYKF